MCRLRQSALRRVVRRGGPAPSRRAPDGRDLSIAGGRDVLAGRVDLDGSSWREDVGALRDSARELDIPVLVERSRSGNGAHLWVLFSRPVSARVARAVGSVLLTCAMRRRSISMNSYDRLFPNQDTMPAGGFGNLRNRAHRRDPGTARAPRHKCPRAPASVDPRPDRRRRGLPDGPGRDSGRRAGPGPLRPPTADRGLRQPRALQRARARLSTHKTPRVIACHEDTGDRLLLPRGWAWDPKRPTVCFAQRSSRPPSQCTSPTGGPSSRTRCRTVTGRDRRASTVLDAVLHAVRATRPRPGLA
jgi:hypothetical protein